MVFCIGRKYTDKVTGFTGMATCRTEHLYGTTQLHLQAEQLGDSKVVGHWFYEAQLQEADPSEATEDDGQADAAA